MRSDFLVAKITMTQATELDLREIKTTIDANTRSIDAIGKMTEANTIAIAAQSDRIEATTKIAEVNTKAISDLTASIIGLREEMRVGFASVDTKLAKLEGKIDNAETKLAGKIDTLSATFDERTKGIGQRLDSKELAQRNIFTGLTVAIVGGMLLAFGKYLFFGTLP
jgi:chromosome segregation ATPase